ncbi:MAG: lysozyme [Synechococcus sp.]
MSRLTLDGFKNFFRYFKEEPQQSEALEILWKAMPVSLLEEDTSWIVKFREDPPANTGGIPQDAINLIKNFEGFRSSVYNDGVGVATIGYGATFYEDGRKVDWGDPSITEKRGEELLTYHLQYFWGVQESTIPYWKEMTDGQRGCLLSFSFNCGAHFYGSSGFNTITGCLRDKRWSDVPNALRLYVNPGTSVEAGLRRRREAEIELWLS